MKKHTWLRTILRIMAFPRVTQSQEIDLTFTTLYQEQAFLPDHLFPKPSGGSSSITLKWNIASGCSIAAVDSLSYSGNCDC